jgi:hypothetical protein
MRFKPIIILLCFVQFPLAGQEEAGQMEEPFERLAVTGNIHLQLVLSDFQKLQISKGGQEEDLQIINQDGTLSVKTKSEASGAGLIEGKLYYVKLSGLEVVKGGRVQSTDTLKTSMLELDILSGGKAELYILADQLDVRVNQGADIILYGRVKTQHIDAYTWGNYLGYDLKSDQAHVKAATGAQVKVWASDLLKANATSKGFVGFMGEPTKKEIKTSVGGEVTAQDP